MFSTASRRATRLPSFGNGLNEAYDYSPYSKAPKRGGGGAGVLVWVVALVLVASLAGLGTVLQSARRELGQLNLHVGVLEEQLMQEKVCVGLRMGAPARCPVRAARPPCPAHATVWRPRPA
jgi:hypothetical protein